MHLNIAICDDDEKDRDILDAFLHAICDEWDINARILHYSSGEEFLFALKQKYSPDIIFMDIYLSGINGIETAKDISRTGKGRFIFTTTSRDHALEAFALNAAHYLVKPLAKNAVREALRRCLPRHDAERPKLLEIKTGHGIVPVRMDNIVYIEVLNKICTIHTEKDSFQTYTSLDALSELLDGASFIRAQRSFIVNMKYIESFYFDHIVLQGGKEISLSRNSRADLKKQYQQFLFHLARRDAI